MPAVNNNSAERAAAARPGAGGLPVLELGFRPFFLAAGAWAALAMALWLAMLAGYLVVPSAFDPIAWHVHEMIFGYAMAAIAGFLLTAVPNWTGRLPVRGPALAALAALWLVGRAAVAGSAHLGAFPAAVLDVAFPLLFLVLVGREIVAGRTKKNLLMVALLALLTLASAMMHVEAMGGPSIGAMGQRLGVAAVLFLIAVIGGRITPSFTRNWLAKRAPSGLPSPFGTLDGVALVVTASALTAWVAAPVHVVTSWLALAAGLALAARLARWRGWRCAREPLVLVLHVAYAWLPVGFVLLAGAGLDATLPASAALHALTAGAIGTMTLAVMTRATLGHSGRPLTAGPGTSAIYVLVSLAALTRVVGPIAGGGGLGGLLLLAAGLVWIAGFVLFLALYGPILLRPRQDTPE